MSRNHRPPVVVVLGHVDHGKTTLLDYIRKANVSGGEAGGITQGIGGYEATVPVEGYQTDKITFIDTPGHEAFTEMRARGANVADIAILIVDATASVKPQTIESISHIKEAKLPFIVAINKVDMKNARVDKIKQDLAGNGVQVEGIGGTIPVVPISAKEGTGVQDLLEGILYLASESDLVYDLSAELEAYVIEAHQEKAGVSVSCVIKNGSIKVGDTVFIGDKQAKIRSLVSDSGIQIKEVVPSMPFAMFGFKEIPEVGGHVSREKQESKLEKKEESTAEDVFNDFFQKDDTKKLKIVIRVDSQGSLDAIVPNLEKNENLEIVLGSIGDVSKSDIFLAKVAGAIIIAFNVKISKSIEKLGVQEKVVIKSYNIIYNLIEELEEVSDLMKEKDEKARNLKGEAKIQAIFNIDGNKIAGIKITKGRFDLNDHIELVRGKKPKGEAILTSIKQRAHTVKEAKKDEEAGLLLEPELDIQAGDVVLSYSI